MSELSVSTAAQSLWIVGGGGAALQAWSVVRAQLTPQFVFRGFIVSEAPRFDCERYEVIQEDAFFLKAAPHLDCVVIAVGNPLKRQALADRYSRAGFQAPVMIHPSVIMGPSVEIGQGSIVLPGAIIETHVEVGSFVLVNLSATIAHECKIGSFTNIGPASCLSGGTRIGKRCDLGAGVVSRPQVFLGDDVIVGAGGVLVRDFSGPIKLIGVPAAPAL